KGFDALIIKNAGLNLYTNDYPLFSGVDHLDVTASDGKANIIVNEAFLAQTDNGALTISYGKGIAMLDTSGFSHGKYDVWLKGAGTVNLSANGDEIRVASGTTGKIYGKEGNDKLYGSDGM